jgi:hypothetical protein
MSLLVALLCWGGCVAAGVNEHNYRYYPCLPRTPEVRLSSALFVPPSKSPSGLVTREFPPVAERSVVAWIYVVSSTQHKLRLLWLFNRAWGFLTNGTMIQTVWKVV